MKQCSHPANPHRRMGLILAAVLLVLLISCSPSKGEDLTSDELSEQGAAVEEEAAADQAGQTEAPTHTPTVPEEVKLGSEVILPENASQVEQLTQIGKGKVQDIAWSPDGTLLAAAGTVGVHLYDSQDFELFRSYDATVIMNCLTFSPDGKLLAIGSSVGPILVWDLENDILLHKLEGHKEIINSLAFSPDGRTIASTGRDQVINLWDAESGDLLHSLVSKVAFSPDGSTVASESMDSTIHL